MMTQKLRASILTKLVGCSNVYTARLLRCGVLQLVLSFLCVCLWVCGFVFGEGVSFYVLLTYIPIGLGQCRPRAGSVRPAPFPGQMSYKTTKPGSVCPDLSIVMI